MRVHAWAGLNPSLIQGYLGTRRGRPVPLSALVVSMHVCMVCAYCRLHTASTELTGYPAVQTDVAGVPSLSEMRRSPSSAWTVDC